MSRFVLIPTNELTNGMIIKSVSNEKSEIPIKYYNNIPYYIVEVEESVLKNTSIYDNYLSVHKTNIETAVPLSMGERIIIKGIINGKVNANTSKTFDWVVNENMVIHKAILGVSKKNINDTINLQVYLPAIPEVSPETLIGQYVYDVNITNEEMVFNLPPSLMTQNLIIRLTYNNTSLIDNVDIAVNFLMFKE
jgi:hypothetical protein